MQGQMFRSKPTNVRAIQWLKDAASDTTEDVIRFLDADYGGESSVGPSINLIVRIDGQGVILPPTSWVLRDTHGHLRVLSDEAFREGFEPAAERKAKQPAGAAS